MIPLASSSYRPYIVGCVVVLLAASASAQLISLDNTTAPPTPGVGHDYIKSFSETVNPANGSLSVRIDLPLPNGRNLRVPFAFTYNSSSVMRVGGLSNGGGTFYFDSAGPMGGWANSIPTLTAVQGAKSFYNDTAWPPTTYMCTYITNYNFTDWSGSTHPLNLSIVQSSNSTLNNCNMLSGPPSPQLVGGDNFYEAVTTGPCNTCVPQLPSPVQVADADGTIYSFSAFNTDGALNQYTAPQSASYSQQYNTGYWGPVSSIEDRNGNILTYSTVSCSLSSYGCNTLTDDASRPLVQEPISANGLIPNYYVLGQSTPYQLTYVSTPVNFSVNSTVFGAGDSTYCRGMVPPTGISNNVVSTLTLPNGQKFQFYYDQTYGLLNKIVYPNGGYVQYTWGVNPQSEVTQLPQIPNTNGVYDVCFAIYDLPAITQRTVSYDGATTAEIQKFSYTTNMSTSKSIQWNSKTATATTYDLVRGTNYQTIYTYTPVFAATGLNAPGSAAPPQIATEQSLVYKDFSGSTLKTAYKSFGGINGMLITCEFDQLDNGLVSGTWYTYASGYTGAVPVDKKDYDYGVVPSGGASSACPNSTAPSNPTRETVTAYQNFPATAIFPTESSILDRPSSVKVYSGGSSTGTLVAETDSTYDGVAVTSPGTVTGHDDTNYGPSYNSRGNLTKRTVLCLGCASNNAATSYTYDTTGQVLSKADPCGQGVTCADVSGSAHTTSYYYADAYTTLSHGGNSPFNPPVSTNAYLTKIVDNLGHVTKFTYDYNAGELTSVTDPNSQATNYVYNDPFWRPTSVSFPDGGSTTYAYNDSPYNASAGTPSVTVTRVVQPGTNAITTTSFDGMHHPILSKLTSDPDGVTSTVTTYDGLGLAYSVTNPYRSSSDSTYGVTTTQYDALARPTLIVEPDGSQVITTYSGNCAARSDEAGRPRVACSDSFGRITQVLEPGVNATGGTPGTGSVTLTGAVQSTTTPATSGSGSVVINGQENWVYYYPCGTSSCPTQLWDQGTISITVNGFQASTSYVQNSTTSLIANALWSILNGSSSPVKATVSGNTITLTAKATGASTNYTLSSISSTSEGQYFANPSFWGTRSGSTLTGGANAGTLYDSGTVSVTVGAFQATASYSQSTNNNPTSLASSLATAFNVGGSPVNASANLGVLTLTANTYGFDTNYQVSTATTWNTGFFKNPSFTEAAASSLTGGANGTDGTPPATTLYTYDVLNNLTCAVQKGTDTTQFTTCAAAPSTWRPRTFTYDSLSRLISSTNPEVNTAATSGTLIPTQYVYDLNSNLMSKTFPAPSQQGTTTSTISYCYDDDNRLTKRSYSASTSCASPVATYTYDQTTCLGTHSCFNVGRRTSMTDAGGSENWDYDTMGRVLDDKRTTIGLAKTTAYTYAPYLNGSISSVSYPSGRVVNYTTGAAERLLAAADSSTNYVSAVHYAPQGALAATGYGAAGNAISVTGIYNNRLQPCWIYGTSSTALAANHQCADTAAIGNMLDLKYNYNPGLNNGNVIGIANNRDTTRSMAFAYDLLNRITSAQTTSTYATSTANCWGELYGIDAWGNLSSRNNLSSQYTGCTQEQSFSTTATVQNQLPLTGNKYDSAGNLFQATVGGATNSYSYNAENQLQSMTGLSTTTNYIYDGDGKRVEKTGGTAKIYWYGADGNVLDETDSTGSFTNTSFSEYIYFGGRRIARRDSGGNVYYYLADHLGTSRVMGQVLSGQSTATLCYDADFYPFGGERTVTNLCSQNYKFTGKERDTESGLDNFGARYYASSFGRFMTSDPSNFYLKHLVDPQGLNPYAYTRNNPMAYVDPDGKDWAKAWADLKTFASSLHLKLSGGFAISVYEFKIKAGSFKAEAGFSVKANAELGNKDYQVQNSVSVESGGSVSVGKSKAKWGESISITKVTGTIQSDGSVTQGEPLTVEKVDSLGLMEGSTSSSSDRIPIGIELGEVGVLGAEMSTSHEGLSALKDAYQNVKDEAIPPSPPPPPTPKAPDPSIAGAQQMTQADTTCKGSPSSSCN